MEKLADEKTKYFCIDNRVMYSIGAAARVSGLLDVDVTFGIPLSVTGKNIFFDRISPGWIRTDKRNKG